MVAPQRFDSWTTVHNRKKKCPSGYLRKCCPPGHVRKNCPMRHLSLKPNGFVGNDAGLYGYRLKKTPVHPGNERFIRKRSKQSKGSRKQESFKNRKDKFLSRNDDDTIIQDYLMQARKEMNKSNASPKYENKSKKIISDIRTKIAETIYD